MAMITNEHRVTVHKPPNSFTRVVKSSLPLPPMSQTLKNFINMNDILPSSNEMKVQPNEGNFAGMCSGFLNTKSKVPTASNIQDVKSSSTSELTLPPKNLSEKQIDQVEVPSVAKQLTSVEGKYPLERQTISVIPQVNVRYSDSKDSSADSSAQEDWRASYVLKCLKWLSKSLNRRNRRLNFNLILIALPVAILVGQAVYKFFRQVE